MSEINKEVLERLLSCKLSTISATCDAEEFLLATAADLFDPTNRKFSVATPAQLPNLYGAPLPKGTAVFVESLGIHVVAMAEQWWTFDGRLYRNDGPNRTVWGWGHNGSGRLGNCATDNNSSPVSVVGGFTDWCQVSAGNCHTLAVRTNGTLWAWGQNSLGQLGDDATTPKSSPVSVVGGFTDWCQVSAGAYRSAAVRTNGTLWTWGYASCGRLGNNSTIAKSSPISPIGGFTDWCNVSVGFSHSVAVRTNGSIWAWGYNNVGQLGDNTLVNKSSPVSVVGGFTDWSQVSVGWNHTLAIRTNGTLWAWGCNGQGKLGIGTEFNKSSPVSVVGGFTDWCQVSSGCTHTVAVRSNGTIWSWGTGNDGELGISCVINVSSPVPVVGGFTDWCQVSAGCRHTAAVRTNGTIWSWGNNFYGNSGTGSTINSSSPVSVVGGFTDWSQVSAGSCHTTALRVS